MRALALSPIGSQSAPRNLTDPAQFSREIATATHDYDRAFLIHIPDSRKGEAIASE
jgi:hypothetical protein